MPLEVLSQLKIATQNSHDQLETVSFAGEIMSQRISRPEYQQLLTKTVFIYNVVEPLVNQLLSKYNDPALSVFVNQRREDAVKDLSYLDKTPSYQTNLQLPRPLNISSVPKLFGALYVLEGARLGGKVIVKALRKNTDLSDLPAFHFYEQNGINTRQRWVAFIGLANQYIKTEQDLEEAQQSARKMFDYFYEVHRQ